MIELFDAVRENLKEVHSPIHNHQTHKIKKRDRSNIKLSKINVKHGEGQYNWGNEKDPNFETDILDEGALPNVKTEPIPPNLPPDDKIKTLDEYLEEIEKRKSDISLPNPNSDVEIDRLQLEI